jgi:hypothetical protein
LNPTLVAWWQLLQAEVSASLPSVNAVDPSWRRCGQFLERFGHHAWYYVARCDGRILVWGGISPHQAFAKLFDFIRREIQFFACPANQAV